MRSILVECTQFFLPFVRLFSPNRMPRYCPKCSWNSAQSISAWHNISRLPGNVRRDFPQVAIVEVKASSNLTSGLHIKKRLAPSHFSAPWELQRVSVSLYRTISWQNALPHRPKKLRISARFKERRGRSSSLCNSDTQGLRCPTGTKKDR